MLKLTVVPPLLLNNEKLSVASDTRGGSCQYKEHYGRGCRGLGDRVRICEIRNDTSWWWQPPNLGRRTRSLF